MGGDRSKDINYANKEESRRSVQFDLAGQSGASRHEFGGNKVNQAGEMIMGILTPDAEVTGLSVELGGVHCNILAHAKQGSFLTAIDADLKLDFDTNDVGEMSNLELAANGKGEKLIKVGFGTIKNKPNEALVKALNKNLKLEGDGQVKIVRVKVENGRIRIEMLTEKGIQAEAKAEGEALLARARADEEIAATTRMGELAADVRRRVKDFPPPPLSMPSMAEKVAAKPEKNPHGPAGFDPAGEEISVVSGEPVGTAAGRWPGDEPPPVKDGHVAKVYEKVPDLPLPPIKPSKPGREMVDESGGQGPARSNLAGSEPQRAEGEIPYWLAAMEAGEAGAPMTEMAAGVPAAEPVEGREPEKRQAVKESKFLGVQDFAEGEVLVDGDGYVVIRPDGELFFVHGGNYQLDEVVRKDWQKVEMRLDDDGNLHAVMPLVEQKKGEVRTYMENLDNITMITDREVIFTRRGDNQWLGVESATGGEKQWILVENQPDGNFKLTRDNLLPIEKMVNPTEAINVLAPRGMVSEVKIFAAGEDPGGANEFIAIFHPEMHEMGLFTLTFSKNKIVLSDGEQERKINWRKREQISFPGIPLVILLEKRGGGWQIRVEKKEAVAEAEMPVMPRRENKSLFSSMRIYNF